MPPHHAITDFIRLRRLIDCSRSDFFGCGIWNRELSESERLRFLCHRDRHRFELRMNPQADLRLAQDKNHVSTVLAAADLPGAQVLAVVPQPGSSRSAHHQVRTEQELRELLADDHPDGIVCKPVYGMAGSDVHVFPSVSVDGATHANGRRWTVPMLWHTLSTPGHHAKDSHHSTDWQIERRTPPHPELAALHGDTLGCVRVVTMRFADGTIGFLTPCWKIPVGDAGVDNLDFGALTAAVDLETGLVGRPIFKRTMVRHDHHPITEARLTGTVMPDWPALLDLARKVMALFPTLRSLGFDIGPTRDGPRLVEVNPYWSIQMMQAPHGRGIIRGEFLRFLEELGAEDVIRRKARGL